MVEASASGNGGRPKMVRRALRQVHAHLFAEDVVALDRIAYARGVDRAVVIREAVGGYVSSHSEQAAR